MGIYIKGVSLDDFKPICPCMNGDYGCCDIPEIKRCYGIGKDGCPLAPVPKHGRLGDLDALADVFRGFIAMYDSCPFSQLSLPDKARRDELQSALAEVINAPTIIPASEEDE